RQFLRYGFIAAAAAIASMVPVEFKKTEGFNVEKTPLPRLGKAEAQARCGMGTTCSGGGGSCGFHIMNCGGGGGKCGGGLNCGGS
ncbi:MAG: hypothetical protein IKX79_06030, partial [Desulfovibrionaceae bacterium]|nr:hypothetical protein [Desulfovibrionaceae bacterium]